MNITRSLVFVLLVAAATIAFGQGVAEQRGGGPIRVGFIAPLSGPNAQNGRDILNGFPLCTEMMEESILAA